MQQKVNSTNPKTENVLPGFDEKQLGFTKDGYEVIYLHASGGKVWRHELVDLKGVDYAEILEVAIDKANLGFEAHILPILTEEHPLRDIIFANAKERKCPDLKINGSYTEVKTPIEKLHDQKISKNIKLAHAQADEVIIRLTSYFDPEILTRIAKGRFLTHEHLLLIEFKMGGEYICFRRSDFI
jgi:hypothetical protein